MSLIIRDGGGGLYTVIQWIRVTSVLQSKSLANGTGEEKVRTVYKQMITILSSRWRPVLDIFQISSFSSFKLICKKSFAMKALNNTYIAVITSLPVRSYIVYMKPFLHVGVKSQRDT